jgi:hypothetical protein
MAALPGGIAAGIAGGVNSAAGIAGGVNSAAGIAGG